MILRRMAIPADLMLLDDKVLCCFLSSYNCTILNQVHLRMGDTKLTSVY